jgi:hypothetical protein
LDRLVFVETWDGRNNFEFAHFTVEEIADALRAAYSGSDPPPSEELIRRVDRCHRAGQNIEKLWEGWPKPRPSKPQLMGTALGPILRERIEQALLAETADEIPIVRVLRTAVRLAYEYPRDGLAFTRAPAGP